MADATRKPRSKSQEQLLLRQPWNALIDNELLLHVLNFLSEQGCGHGYAIRKELMKRGISVAQGQITNVFNALRANGLLVALHDTANPRRVLYRLNELGESVRCHVQDEFAKLITRVGASLPRVKVGGCP
ncbi:MAG TPA: helix-turn-helix transcriptional regulator [Tepidisphaeraceae bacterium]|nr:helix-turn-helix transcriptional regulator [Tepidisphaeraceae bacterium]